MRAVELASKVDWINSVYEALFLDSKAISRLFLLLTLLMSKVNHPFIYD